MSDTDEASKAAGACHFVTARGPLLHIGGNGRCVTNESHIPKLTHAADAAAATASLGS